MPQPPVILEDKTVRQVSRVFQGEFSHTHAHVSAFLTWGGSFDLPLRFHSQLPTTDLPLPVTSDSKTHPLLLLISEINSSNTQSRSAMQSTRLVWTCMNYHSMVCGYVEKVCVLLWPWPPLPSEEVNADVGKERFPPLLVGRLPLVGHSGTPRLAEHSGTESSGYVQSPLFKENKRWQTVVTSMWCRQPVRCVYYYFCCFVPLLNIVIQLCCYLHEWINSGECG